MECYENPWSRREELFPLLTAVFRTGVLEVDEELGASAQLKSVNNKKSNKNKHITGNKQKEIKNIKEHLI